MEFTRIATLIRTNYDDELVHLTISTVSQTAFMYDRNVEAARQLTRTALMGHSIKYETVCWLEVPCTVTI